MFLTQPSEDALPKPAAAAGRGRGRPRGPSGASRSSAQPGIAPAAEASRLPESWGRLQNKDERFLADNGDSYEDPDEEGRLHLAGPAPPAPAPGPRGRPAPPSRGRAKAMALISTPPRWGDCLRSALPARGAAARVLPGARPAPLRSASRARGPGSDPRPPSPRPQWRRSSSLHSARMWRRRRGSTRLPARARRFASRARGPRRFPPLRFSGPLSQKEARLWRRAGHRTERCRCNAPHDCPLDLHVADAPSSSDDSD
jgi:hypothetical protein